MCAPGGRSGRPGQRTFFVGYFPPAEALRLIKEWGFTYKSVAFVWLKKNKKADSWFYGLGFWTRGNAEICLLATRGHPKRQAANIHQFIISVATLLYRPIITLVACHRINRYNDMRTENGERRTENGERRTENGKGSRTLIFRREAYPETFIKTMVIISRYEVEYNKGENIFNKQ